MSPIHSEVRRVATIVSADREIAEREVLAGAPTLRPHWVRGDTGVRELLAEIERAAPDVILVDAARAETAIVASWTGVPVVGIGERPPGAHDLFRSRDDREHHLRFLAGRCCAAWEADLLEGARAASRLLEEGATRAGSVPPGPTTHETLAGVLELWRAIAGRRPGAEMAWTRELARRLVLGAQSGPRAEAPAAPPRSGRPRVAFVAHELSRSGSPILLRNNTRALLAQGDLPWELHVLGLQPGPLAEDFAALGLPTSCPPSSIESAREPDWLLGRLEEIAPDVVLLHGSPLFREAVALKTRGYRVLWWIHSGIHYETREGPLIVEDALAQMVRHALGFPDRVLFGSRDTLEQFTLLSPDLAGRSAHIDNGIPLGAIDGELAALGSDRVALRRALGLDVRDAVLVCVGSLEERKNQLGLVRGFQVALRLLPREVAERARLVLAGSLTVHADPESRYLAAVRGAIEPEFADRIRITGPVESVWCWFAVADAQVLLSVNECQPMVNQEAMAVGVPSLSSRVHGIPEAVTEGVTGWLVDPRDDGDVAAGIARVLRLACDEPETLRAMGRAGREDVARRFTCEVAASRMRAEIEAVLRHAPDARRGVPGGEVARGYLEQLLGLRWALAKGDISAARSISQAHAHRLYRWPPLPPALPAVAVVAAPGHVVADRLLRELGVASLPWSPVLISAPGFHDDPESFSPVLAAIAVSKAVVVVVVGEGLAELVLLARWKGWSPVWVVEDFAAATSQDAGPEFLLDPRRRLELHSRAAAVAVAPAKSDAVIAAVDYAAASERPEDAAPDGASTWRELGGQLGLFRAIFARDGAAETGIVVGNAARWASEAAPRPRPARPDGGRPRVLFVTHQYSRTGAPIELFHLVRALGEQHAGFELVVTGFEDGPMREVIRRDAGVPAMLVTRDPPPFVFDSFLAQLDEVDPDLVILNASVFYEEAALVRLKGRRVVWWIHDGIDLEARRGHLFSDDALATMTLHGLVHPDRLFFPARDTRDQFAACCSGIRDRCVHLPNGIDLGELDEARGRLVPERRRLRRESGIGEDDFVFLCIGSFERRKNQRELLEAFQDLRERDPAARDVHLLFLGKQDLYTTGPDAGFFDEVRNSLREPHLPWVRFLGLETSPFPRLAIADAHVLVSTNESSPLANLEAMAFGIPCLSSRIDGIPEAFGSGDRGILVDPNDRAGIASALGDLRRRVRAGDPSLSAMCSRARAYVEQEHDVAATARLLAREIRAILVARPAESDSSPALRTHEADRYIQHQLIQRWALFKLDVIVEAHIARAHAHRFFRA